MIHTLKGNGRALYIVYIMFVVNSLLYLVIGRSFERVGFVICVVLLLFAIKRVSICWKIDFGTILFLIFFLCTSLCSILFCSVQPVLYACGMLVTYIVSYNSFILFEGSGKWFDRLYDILSGIWLVAAGYSVFTSPIQLRDYKGIFGNPNGCGMTSVTMATLSLIQYITAKQQGCKCKKRVYLFFIVECFFMLVSSCRSALLSMVLQVIVLVIWGMRDKQISHKVILRVILIVLVAVAAAYCSGILSVFIKKTIHVMNYTGDILNGRKAYWVRIWQESRLFHDGSNRIDVTSHNVYLGLVNQFGKVPGIVFLCFILYQFLISFRVLKTSYRYKWAFVLASINFLVLSMFENILMTLPMCLMFVCLGFSERSESCRLTVSNKREKMHFSVQEES